MIEDIFIFLVQAIDSNWYFALFSSFAWGILSVILSPCHLGSIPLIVAFIHGQGKIALKKAFIISVIFSLGILVAILILGIVTSLAGRVLGNIGLIGNMLVISVFIIVGLNFLGIIQFNGFNFSNGFHKKSLLTSFFLGLVIGLSLGPCSFSFMAPVLALVFKLASSDIFFAFLLVLFYAIGHCLVFIIFGTFTNLTPQFLKLKTVNKGTSLSKKIIGIIIIFIALYLIFKQFIIL